MITLLEGIPLGTFLLHECEVFAEVNHIGIESEWRFEHDGHIEGVGDCALLLGFKQVAVTCRIGEATIGHFHIEISETIWREDAIRLLCSDRQGK